MKWSMLILLCLSPIHTFAQTETTESKPLKFLTARPLFDPLIANPSDPQTQILVFAISKPFEYATNPHDNHKIWDFKFGGDQNLFVVDGKSWAWGVWFPYKAQAALDFGEPGTPIVAANFGLGLSGKVAYSLSTNNQLSFLVMLGHESDHVLDEYIFNAEERYGKFPRVDVNNQYLQFGVNLDHKIKTRVVTNRLTLLKTLDFWSHEGFYSYRVRGYGNILPSTRNYKPAYGFQYVPKGGKGFRTFFSYYADLSTVFDYWKLNPNKKDSSQFSQSLAFGMCDVSNHITPALLFRFYYGTNFFGQFGKNNQFGEGGVGFANNPC